MAAAAEIAKDKAMVADANEIKLRAERALGQMMKAQAATVGKAKGGGQGGNRYARAGVTKTPAVAATPSLKSAGIDKNMAKAARRAAQPDDDEFEKTSVPTARARAGHSRARLIRIEQGFNILTGKSPLY